MRHLFCILDKVFWHFPTIFMGCRSFVQRLWRFPGKWKNKLWRRPWRRKSAWSGFVFWRGPRWIPRFFWNGGVNSMNLQFRGSCQGLLGRKCGVRGKLGCIGCQWSREGRRISPFWRSRSTSRFGGKIGLKEWSGRWETQILRSKFLGLIFRLTKYHQNTAYSSETNFSTNTYGNLSRGS